MDLSALRIFVPVVLICVGCWVSGYFLSVGFPVYGEVSSTPIWNLICNWIPGKAAAYLIGGTLTLAGALLLNRANYVLALIREKTRLPFLFYLLFISTNPDFFPLKPTSLGVFCLILAIYQLFLSYHDPDARDRAFNSAFLIGLGSLLWVHLLWFMPLIWVGMYRFRTLSIRTFAASLIGLSTIYWFLLGWCVIEKDFTPFSIPFSGLFKFNVINISSFSGTDWISILVVAFLTLCASINIILNDIEDSLRSRQYLSFLIVMAVWSFALFFLYESSSEEFLEMACVPASLLIAHFFAVTKGRIRTIAFFSTIAALTAVLIIQIWIF